MAFRVRLNLSHFFDDIRKYAYVFINPEWTSIKCLQDHVKDLFELDYVELVTDDMTYLPPKESISVVSRKETLTVMKSFKNCDDRLSTVNQLAETEDLGRFENCSEDDNVPNTSVPTIMENGEKKRKKRSRRKKVKHGEDNLVDKTNLRMLRDDDDMEKVVKSHIIFDDNGQIAKSNLETPETIPIEFKCYLEDLDEITPRIISSKGCRLQTSTTLNLGRLNTFNIAL